MFANPLRKNKVKTAVDLEFSDRSRMIGYIFVLPSQRLSDVLNDERAFLPVLDLDGHIHHIHKSIISRVVEVATGGVQPTDPYAVLGLPAGVETEAIRTAYRALAKENHPDRWAAVGLPEEIRSALNTRMMRINDAYFRLMRERRVVDVDGPVVDSS